MDSSFSSEKDRRRRAPRGKTLNPENRSTMFCPNCSGSGRYFYPEGGVNGCLVCGGVGLIRIERSRIDEDKGIVRSLN
jgi:hypothetical protein